VTHSLFSFLILYGGTFAIGIGVGLASLFLGLGGGLLIVPLLPLISGVSAREAIGTSLLTVFFVSLQNAWMFYRESRIDLRAAAYIGLFGAISSFIAGRLTDRVPEFMLHTVFFVVLILLAITSFMWRGKKTVEERPLTKSFAAGVGLTTGLISGFTGVGGGIFVVPALSFSRRVLQEKIVPTSVATIVITSFAGSFAFLSEAVTKNSLEIRPDLAIALFLGAITASQLFRTHQKKLTPRNRDWLIGGLLLILAIRTLILIIP
jgi:uncharacterized membrane protein YfcA